MITNNKVCRVRAVNMSTVEINRLRCSGANARLEMNILKTLKKLIKLKIIITANKACRVRPADMSAIERNDLRGYGA